MRLFRHDLAKILLYFAATIALAALLAPPLFWAGRALGGAGPAAAMLAEMDFQRYFNRAFLIAALALLWPLARALRIRSVADFGIEPNRRWRGDLLFGFGAAMACIWAYGAVLLAAGLSEFKDPLPWHRIPSALGTAAAVSVIEEAFFRGGLLGVLLRTLGRRSALVAVSAIYSIVHFLKPPEGAIPPESVTWLSGFALVPLVFRQFAEPLLLLSGFGTLFLLGWIFGAATVATRSLWLAIGLHAGAILAARSFSVLTKRQEAMLPWVGENLATGLAPLAALGLLLGLCHWFILATGRGPARHERGTQGG